MAKIDAVASRASALADEAADEFFRPAKAPRPRKSRALPSSSIEADFRSFDAADDLADGDSAEREEEAFLRSRRRVPVRRGLLPENRLGRIALIAGAVCALAVAAAGAYATRQFLLRDPRFRIPSSAAIQIDGISEVSRAQLLSIFGSDIDNNIFAVPLADRRAELERLPWVGHATVMRLLPNRLRISIIERTPVAFVRTGNEIGLVDINGVLLTMPPDTVAARHYSFPVVTGINEREPLSTRAARMQIYEKFLADIDSGGEKVSDMLSEVDLTDPEDVRAVMPEQGSDILAHFGDDKFLSRYRNYKAHLAEWRQQYPHLASVDLRYDQQVVLEMEKGITTAPSEPVGARSLDDQKAEVTSRPATATAHKTTAPKSKPVAHAARSTHAVSNTAKPSVRTQP